MTVKEMIEKLSALPQDVEVMTYAPDFDNIYPVDVVKLTDRNIYRYGESQPIVIVK